MRHGARPRDSTRDPVIQARHRHQPAAVPYAPGPVFCLPDWGSTLARMHRLAAVAFRALLSGLLLAHQVAVIRQQCGARSGRAAAGWEARAWRAGSA